MTFLRTSVVLFALSCPCIEAAYFKGGLRVGSQSFLNANNTIFTEAKHELEKIENVILFKHKPVVRNKLIYTVLGMIYITNVCGIDRCFMGSIGLGVAKGCGYWGATILNIVVMRFTGGVPICGCLPCIFGIWFVVDFWVAGMYALTMKKDIEIIGYNVEFEQGSVEPAYYAACILLAICLCLPIMIICMYVCCFAMLFSTLNAGGMGPPGFEDHEERPQGFDQHVAFGRAVSGKFRDNVVTKMPNPITKVLRQCHQISAEPSEAEIRTLFDTYDTNHDGSLDKEEFKTGLAKIGVNEEQAMEWYEEIDLNHDGKLSIEEFITSMANKAEKEEANKTEKDLEKDPDETDANEKDPDEKPKKPDEKKPDEKEP